SLNNDSSPRMYPASYNCDNIISVLATDHYDNMSSFSNYGSSSVDLGAPGSSILSCGIGGYTYKDGTSMATPHVAGACALVLSINSSLDYDDVKEIILDNTDSKSSLSGKCVTEGRLNLYNSVNNIPPNEPPDANAYIVAYNSLGEGVAWFDELGNLCLSGTLTEQSSCTLTGYSGLKIRNTSNNVIAIINASNGNMYISGKCYKNQGFLSPSNSKFTVKNDNGDVIAYINNSGNLYLKGWVYEL
ncbi:MAG: S8 family serine peptidase, partial [Phycisphaerales bacterium]